MSPAKKKPEKVPNKLTRIPKLVANLTGNAKATKINNAPKGTTQPTPASTNPKISPKENPRVEVGNFNKVFPKTQKAFDTKCLQAGTLSDIEAEVLDEGLEGYVKDTKHVKLEHMQPSSKRKHADGPHKRIKIDKAELVPQTTPKCSGDTSQPPLPRSKTSTHDGTTEVSTTKITKAIITTVDTFLPPVVTSPLKPAAANSGVIHSKPVLAYSTNRKNEDTSPLRRTQNWVQAVSPPKRKLLSYTDTPSISDEDHGDLGGKVNELHDHRRNQENQSAKKTKRFVKVVSENETMPSSRGNGYEHTKGTSAKSDRKQCGTDEDKSPQWDPRPIDYKRCHIRGPQRGTPMQYRSRTESKRSLSPNKRDRSDSGNQSAQSKWNGRSHRRMRYGQGILMQGRESSTDQRDISKRHTLSIVETHRRSANSDNAAIRPPFSGEIASVTTNTIPGRRMQPC